MPLDGTENDICKLKEVNKIKQDPCLLLSLPLELREKIYIYYFEKVHSRSRSPKYSYFRNALAILGTCTKLQQEASSVLFDRTPLRFLVTSSQSVSSDTPPPKIMDRFQNVYFKIEAMAGSHGHYEFRGVFGRLTKALLLSSSLSPPPPSILRRRSCYIQCNLSTYTCGDPGEYFQDRLKSFTAFETVTIDFTGSIKRFKFPQPAVADDDPHKTSKLSSQGHWEAGRQGESSAFTRVGEIFRILERYLGKGRIVDLSEGSDMLYARRIEFCPFLDRNETIY